MNNRPQSAISGVATGDSMQSDLIEVVERFKWTDYRASIVILGILVFCLFLLFATSFVIARDSREALLMITAMVCSLFLGWGIAALLSPISPIEETRFPRLVSAMGGVASGFTLAKAGSIVDFFDQRFHLELSTPVANAFFLLGPLACFLAGLLSSFILRSMFYSMEENRLQVMRRELMEKRRAAKTTSE